MAAALIGVTAISGLPAVAVTAGVTILISSIYDNIYDRINKLKF